MIVPSVYMHEVLILYLQDERTVDWSVLKLSRSKQAVSELS